MDNAWRTCLEVPLAYSDLRVSDGELFAALGYGDARPADDVQAIIDRLKAQADEVCKPRFGYRILEGAVNGSELILGDVSFATDAIIAHQLKPGECFAVLVASVGAEMDAWLHGFRTRADVVEAFVSDALGSVIAEAIVAYGLDYLERVATPSGMHLTNSYSPGYCGWNVAEQHRLFGLLPEAFCGVTLCDSGLMLPIKSVSAVAGIGDKAVRREYGCALCRKEDCYKRRVRSR